MEVRKGYKMTEVGVVPEDWEVKKFMDITNLITCGMAATPTYVDSGNGVPFLSSTNVKRGKVVFKNYKHISKQLHERLYKNNPPLKGDILYSRVGTIGEAAVILTDLEFSIYVSLTLIKVKEDISASYIAQQLNSKFFKRLANDTVYLGGGVGNLNVGVVREFQIPLPPTLHEQNLIATALGDADAWIRSLEALLAKKRRVKEGVMGELLRPGVGWREVRLGEVASIIGGGTPTTANPDYWEGEINWFTPTEVGKTKHLYESRRKITQEGLVNSSAKMLPVNTILLTSRAGIGDLGILKVRACTNQGFQSLVAFDDTDVDFLYYWLSVNTDKLLEKASGSTFLEISPKAVAAIELSIPNYDEQIRIAEILSTLDAELRTLTTQLTKARALKAGMMGELLTGRVRLV